jgi:tetratricopeptide (TPR) repeat protein
MNRKQRRASDKHSKTSASPRTDTPAAYFEAGLRLLKAGQLAEAEACGSSALALDAGHAGSLHLMGMLCLLSRRSDLAIEWFAQAIRQDPTVSDYFFNLARALEQQGRVDDAVKSLDRGLALKPGSVGEWLSLSRLLQQQKRFDEAIKCCDRALVLDPDQAEIWFRMGDMLRHQKRPDEAIMSFDKALELKPDYREAANASGLLYFEAKRYEEAIARFTTSVEIDPSQAGAYNFISRCQWPLRRFDDALANGHKAYALAPDAPEIAKNIGLILQKLERHEEAMVWFNRALSLWPDFPSALNDRSGTMFALRRIDEAFADLDRAIALDPECADYHWNKALLQLLVGDFDAGWRGREWGRKCALVGFVDRKFTKPHWFGDEPIAGKTILLHSDEGLGDTIQYSRYAAKVAELGARVILEVEVPLHPLLTGMAGVSLCVPKLKGVAPPDFDLHCPLSGLPLAFKTTLETIPALRAYLPTPPDERLRAWRDRLGSHDRLRVGLVWSGHPGHGNDRNRSTTLKTMSSVLDPRARFYSLQKEPRPDDKATLQERSDIINLTPHLVDFVDTASLISCLDLVITVDTSVAHLSAALGCPTWILLPYTPDYRWLLGRDDSPWYPSARLFRQDERRDYAHVLARVRGELDQRIDAFSPR